ncbi:hypothetical protein C0416_04825 [bacterium]|nr:hypothetical protein [bacterium]
MTEKNHHPRVEKIVYTEPKRKNFVAYSKTGKELCVPVVIKYSGSTMHVSPVNLRANGVALEFYFTPAFSHEMNPTLYCFFTKTLPDHFLVPATYRNARADDWSNSHHPPVSAGWLRAGRDGKLWLERDEEPSAELETANVDESLVAIATKFWEVYAKVDEIERTAEFIG